MQVIKMYVSGAETLGVVRDSYNAKTVAAPTFVRGCEVVLQLRLFQDSEGLIPYPHVDLEQLTNWQFVMDSDFVESTTPKLQNDPGKIWLQQVTEVVGDEEVTFTEFWIQISNMNTEELVEWLGNTESKSGLHAELIGYGADGTEKFVLQIKNFTVRNRIAAQGEPTEISPDYLTAGQVTALIASGFAVQFSADKTSWHDTQGSADLYYRFRSASSSSAAWSSPIELVRGPAGSSFKPDAFGAFSELSKYNNEKAGFIFLATDTGYMYTKTSDASGAWDNGFKFSGDPGPQGEPGTDAPRTDYNPVLSPTFRDATNGRYCRLDDDYTTVTIAENIIAGKSMRMHIKSADSAVSGKNVVLTVTVGTQSVTKTVAVSGASWVTFDLPAADGVMTIVRNTENSNDTLKSSGTVVSLIVDAVEITYNER